MESEILNSPEKPINLTSSENTKANERDSPKIENYPQNGHQNNNYHSNDIIYPNHNGESTKRHRRKKNDIIDRQFQCPDCDKWYLSSPALITHRKTKHGYELNSDNKIRGRPKKDDKPQNPTVIAQNKFNNFFRNETRKPPFLDQTMNDKTISLEIIKNNLSDIFRQCQKDLFNSYEKVEKISFLPINS